MRRIIALTILLLAGVLTSQAQPAEAPSAKKAFGLSLLVPGAGHYYASGGRWNAAATTFTAAEAGLWLTLAATLTRRSSAVSAYETLAVTRAGALVDGKDRTFFLYLASYRSSSDFRDAMLRARAWDQIDFVAERGNQWAWQSEEDFQHYRRLRDDSESLRRQRAFLIALMGANRVISAVFAARLAGSFQERSGFQMALEPHPSSRFPMVGLSVTW